MRRAIFVACALMTMVTVGLFADEEKAGEKQTTLEGRLIDLSCYAMGMGGEKHSKCALLCAEKGLPVGVLEAKTGKVFTVLLPSPGLATYVEQSVRITGKVHSEVLFAPKMMEVREGKEWKEVKLPSAM